MSPRPYNLGKRQEQIDEARDQVLDAARALLREADSYGDFTVDAVARRADVARATVYYQFGSKTGLLEGLCDHLAELGGLSQLPEAFTNPDPEQALAAFITAFGRFWQADRTVMRRLRALAALDPEVKSVITARDQRRHQGLNVLVRRLIDEGAAPADLDHSRAVRILTALTSFETFDALSPPEANLADAVPEILHLAGAALDRPSPGNVGHAVRSGRRS
jgi:AcrR family transcriptional regulator